LGQRTFLKKQTMSKVFIGAWVSKETRSELKSVCAKKTIYQGDVIELLILNWLKKPHVKND
jgi:hypothetical protein